MRDRDCFNALFLHTEHGARITTHDYAEAITSISTEASFGNRATCTVDRAGCAAVKYFA